MNARHTTDRIVIQTLMKFLAVYGRATSLCWKVRLDSNRARNLWCRFRSTLLGFGCLFALGLDAAVVTPSSVQVSSFYGVEQEPNNLINGSGLLGSGDILSRTHHNSEVAVGMWHSNGSAVSSAWVSFDLGSSYTVTSAYIWQMNQLYLLGRGVKNFRIYTSSAATGPINHLVGTFSLNVAGGTTNEAHQSVNFPATVARRILFEIIDNWNGLANDYVGLAEVRFEGVKAITSGLMGYWKFDETSGVTAADSSGNGRSGLVQNSNADGGQWVAGKVGRALRFRGANAGGDYVSVANWAWSSSGEMSLSAWVLVDTVGPESLFGSVTRSTQSFSSAQEFLPLPVAAWQHVVMVASGNQFTIYRNGVQVGQGFYDGTLFNPAGALMIGARMANGASLDSLFQGKIDEVACWDRGLDQDEVFKIFAAGNSSQPLLLAGNFSNSPPILAEQLIVGNVYANGALSLKAAAAGFGPLTYQWWKDGVPLLGANSSTYYQPSASFSAAGKYWVVVTDRHGRSSTSALLNVFITLPTLQIGSAALPGDLLLTWPADAGHYRLESSMDLLKWQNVPLGGANSYAFTPEPPGQFFRLAAP